MWLVALWYHTIGPGGAVAALRKDKLDLIRHLPVFGPGCRSPPDSFPNPLTGLLQTRSSP